jgi:hypothetical protein
MVAPVPRAAPSSPPQQPHDALFKWAFSQRKHAVGLLRTALPAAWVAKADLRTLRLERGSFVNRALRSRQSDLVLSIRVGAEKVYFYVLVEQQRKVQPLMVVRMGIYLMRLYEELLRDQPKLDKIPVILPLLVHHSKRGWTAATAFQSVVLLEEALRAELWRYIPHFEMRVLDLRDDPAARVTGEAGRSLTALGKVVLWALSVAGDDARLEREIGDLGPALAEVLLGPEAGAALEALLRYLAATHPRLQNEKLGEILENAAGPEAQEVIVTWMDELKLRARAEVLLEQLCARFGAVPDEIRARVQSADEATLMRWAVGVLTAPSIEQTLAPARASAIPRKPAASRKAAPSHKPAPPRKTASASRPRPATR